MKVWRKQSTKYVNAKTGRRTTKDDPQAVKRRVPSKRYYGTLTRSDGKRRQIPLCEDRQASETLLRRLQAEADRDRSLGIAPADRERQRSISDFVTRYVETMRAKGRTDRHVNRQRDRINAVLTGTKATTPERIDADAVVRWLGKQSETRKRFGITTQNHHAVALKGFTRWLWTTGVLDADPLRSLRKRNAEADRRKQRRALTADEVRQLIETTRTKRKRLQWLTAERRSLLYAVAVSTGLRAAELASLRRASFDLEAGTLWVAALVTKNRQTARMPLPPSLVSRLRPVLEALQGDALLFPGAWYKREAARMVRSDCKRAGIDTTDVDFHGLRTTYITSLARSGVHPAIAQRLARHSTITLTMNVYTKLEDAELREAVEGLPDVFG